MPKHHAPHVEKRLRLGKRGGLFYINAAGRRVYLKQYQRVQCLRTRSLPGDANRACQQLIAQEAAIKGEGFVPRYGHIVLKPK